MHVESKEENENIFRLLFKQSTDAMMILMGNVFVYCNQAAAERFGCSDRNQLLSLHPSSVSPEKQLNGRAGLLRRKKSILPKQLSRVVIVFEWLHRRVNGDIFPAEVLLKSIPVPGEKIIHATLRDSSERKQAEEELRAV